MPHSLLRVNVAITGLAAAVGLWLGLTAPQVSPVAPPLVSSVSSVTPSTPVPSVTGGQNPLGQNPLDQSPLGQNPRRPGRP